MKLLSAAIAPVVISLVASSSLFVACSSASDAPSANASDASTGDDGAIGDDDTKDAGADGLAPIVLADAGDYGAVSTTYPAFTVNAPQIVKGAGSVMPSPIAITITWTSDPDEAT